MAQIDYVIKKDSSEKYHSNKEYIGSTSLKKYAVSPAHFLASQQHPREVTKEMQFGTAYHIFILENELFDEQIFVYNENKRPFPDKDFRTKENKIWKDELLEKNKHKQCVSLEDYEKMIAMRASLMNNPFAWNLLQGEREMSYYVTLNGVKVKIRPDSYLKGHYKADLKTCQNASPAAFKNHAYNLGYHISAALYSDILDLINDDGTSEGFFFVAQEKEAPYAVAVYLANESFMAQGRHEYESYLQHHKKCLETGIYKGYEIYSQFDNGVFELDLPAYAFQQLTLTI